MMTVHSAKGLEFASVFLTGMEDEIFPYRGSGRASTKSSKKSGASPTSRSRARASSLFVTHAAARMLFGQTRYEGRAGFSCTCRSKTSISFRRAARRLAVRRPYELVTGVARPRTGSTGVIRWRRFAALVVAPPAPRAPTRQARRTLRRSRGLRRRVVSRRRGRVLQRGARVRHARFGEGEVRTRRTVDRAHRRRVLSGVGREEDPCSVLRTRLSVTKASRTPREHRGP